MSQDNNEVEDQRLMIERAVLGQQIESFFNTDMGRYMKIRANAQKEDGIDALKTCDPEDASVVRKHQNTVWLAENVIQWLEQAVEDGLRALEVLDDRT